MSDEKTRNSLKLFTLKETGLIKIQTQIRVVKIQITSVRIFCLRQMSKINFIRRRFIICSCSAFSQIFREIGFGRFGPLKNHLDISLGAFRSQFRAPSFIKNRFWTGFLSKFHFLGGGGHTGVRGWGGVGWGGDAGGARERYLH